MFKKILRSIVPAVLITLPIGSVYAFSLFAPLMSEHICESIRSVQFAFSLSIFFLGMGAAFFGPLVEKNIKVAGIIAACLFGTGCIVTALSMQFKSIWLLYLGYGLLCGLGQGTGYIVPVKTLLLWFPKHKGLAAAVSIISFGLGSSFCSWLFKIIYPATGIVAIYAVLAVIYFWMMLFGSFLIKKPKAESDVVVAQTTSNMSLKQILCDRFFLKSWLFMFLNISAGLALIGVTASMFKEVGISNNAVIALMVFCGVMNGAGRLVFAAIADALKTRLDIWLALLGISIILAASSSCAYLPVAVAAMVLGINACYGAGFSTIPGILSDHYGNNQLSTIHGLTLSAWGFAGLVGNQLSILVHNITGSFYSVAILILAMYIVNFINVAGLRKISKK